MITHSLSHHTYTSRETSPSNQNLNTLTCYMSCRKAVFFSLLFRYLFSLFLYDIALQYCSKYNFRAKKAFLEIYILTQRPRERAICCLFNATLQNSAVARAVPWFGLLPRARFGPDPRPPGPDPRNNTQLHASGFNQARH